MTRLRVVTVVALVCISGLAEARPPKLRACEPNDGAPFGETSEQDQEQLVAFAKANGLDLLAALSKVYAGDDEALGAVFRLSERFKELGLAARVYGNMLYSVFLNLGEARGLESFTGVLLGQNAATRQRVRDFLYYSAMCLDAPTARAAAEESVRRDFPRLWPSDYVFARGDALFE